MRPAIAPFRALRLIAFIATSGCGQRVAVDQPVGVDTVLVEKAARQLTLLSGGAAVRSYAVALGRHPVGANTASAYHLALHVSYPNASDVAHAAQLGVSPGGDIMIHGIRNGLGCGSSTGRAAASRSRTRRSTRSRVSSQTGHASKSDHDLLLLISSTQPRARVDSFP
jgi:hypothetical protein